MSQINKKITEKYTQTAFSKNNSLFYGEVVGKGNIIYEGQETYNVRIYKGNPNSQNQNGEVLKNLPFRVSKSTVLASLEIGDKVLVGYINSDGGSPYILPVSTTATSNVGGREQDMSDERKALDTGTDPDDAY